jgi:uncharacterized membrane protein
MALDHANHFVAQQHSGGEHWGGPFPEYGDALSFLTRLVTHPVAPAFSFLMGAGMLLFASSRRHRGWSEWAITRHFLIRGVFLILLQLLVINRAWGMGPGRFANVYQGVLVALGGGMVSGAFCLRLKPSIVLLLAGGLFVGTELMHPDPSQWGQNFGQPLGLMLAYSGGDGTYWSNYPILPWLELVLFGQLFGHWLLKDPRQAYQRALLLGGAFLLGFIAVRALDGFGNVRPRSGDSWIDFFNVVKYPPAMSFTLLTMGFNLILLWLLSQVAGWRTKLLSPLALFGRSPLFFYTLHLYVYALLGRLFTPSGSSILGMLPYWLLGLIILFPLCHQYASYKQRQPEGSLLRLL